MPTEIIEIKTPESTDEVAGCVVFLHGFRGNAKSTWSANPANEDAFWPSWVARVHPKLRVFSIDYDADAVGTSLPIYKRTMNILALLKAHDVISNTPFVLVGHSMGGILANSLMLRASNQKLDHLLERHRGTVYFGTPHKGSELARNWTRRLPAAFFPRTIPDLASDSSFLEMVFDDYKSYAKGDETMKHLNFMETKPTFTVLVAGGPTGVAPAEGSRDVPVDYNHPQICKITRTEDERFKVFLRDVEEALGLKAEDRRQFEKDLSKEGAAEPVGKGHRVVEFIAATLGQLIPWFIWVGSLAWRSGNLNDVPTYFYDSGNIVWIAAVLIMLLFSIVIIYLPLIRDRVFRAFVSGFCLHALFILSIRLLGGG